MPDHSRCAVAGTESITGSWWSAGRLLEERFAALRFPLVAKPFDGRSSQGLKILESESDLRFLLNSCSEERKQQYLVQPKIGGTVITVDVVRNPETKQTFCLPRRELLRVYFAVSC